MKISRLKKTFVLVTIAFGTLAIGCELIVDFDRTRILDEGVEASVPDVALPETGTTDDAGEDAQALEDAATDAAADDAGEDAGTDADTPDA